MNEDASRHRGTSDSEQMSRHGLFDAAIDCRSVPGRELYAVEVTGAFSACVSYVLMSTSRDDI